jgi:hypothetical protein
MLRQLLREFQYTTRLIDGSFVSPEFVAFPSVEIVGWNRAFVNNIAENLTTGRAKQMLGNGFSRINPFGEAAFETTLSA